ncbi:hypothetical protein SUGI_1061340 [Cryptomeria japonica]|uniref:uncharacterized protein LOC131071896 n=1 Tax=Cryptomeria japonica TaxID=3369 RepID=UPI002414C98C|nr:uncharacterized protein LOC131071896 [Cryptomeria japonica]GLJ49922.1 hypothetical protein SUGI_1061340 [Cryptomeria japonica]
MAAALAGASLSLHKSTLPINFPSQKLISSNRPLYSLQQVRHSFDRSRAERASIYSPTRRWHLPRGAPSEVAETESNFASQPTGVESIDDEVEEGGSEISDGADVDQAPRSAIQALLHSYKEAIAVNDENRIADIENQLHSIENERDALLKQVASSSEELLAYKDRFLRLNADFANFRKRSERERLSFASEIKGEVIESLLPMVDSFERAKMQIKIETEGEEKIDNSYQSIYKQFVQIMRALGVSIVETVGHRFDPTLHEAIMREASTEFEEGIIIEEFRRGFKLGEKLLRPAMVKVSAGPPAAKSVEASAETSEQSLEGAGTDDSSSDIRNLSAETAEKSEETTKEPEKPISSEAPVAESVQ